jgi:hypothetical protein
MNEGLILRAKARDEGFVVLGAEELRSSGERQVLSLRLPEPMLFRPGPFPSAQAETLG